MTYQGKTDPIVTILGAVDFNVDCQAVTPRAVALGRQFGASVELVHVLEDVGLKDDYRRRWPAAIGQLEGLLGKEDSDGVAATTCVLDGVAGPCLVDEMKDHKADLMVMGFHRDRPLGGVTLGSSMRHVIAHTDRDVLLVDRTPGYPYQSVLIAWDGEKPLGPAIARARYYAPKAALAIVRMVDTAAEIDSARVQCEEAIAELRAPLPDDRIVVTDEPLGRAINETVKATHANLLIMPTRGGRHGDIGYVAERIIAERACDTLCCQASCLH